MTNRITKHRLERIEGLARLWGILYFFHPRLQNHDERWERALIRAIPRVEAARTVAQYAAALNETLFADLNDGLSFACPLSPASQSASAPSETPAGRLLSRGVAYLDMRDAAAYASPDYAARLMEALQPFLQAPGLILDMRWQKPLGEMETEGALFFGFTIDKPIREAATIQRVHYGWSEDGRGPGYGERLEVTPGATIYPIRDSWLASLLYRTMDRSAAVTYTGRLAVLVNDLSYERLAPSLASLQDERDALIVHETAGQVQSRYRLALGREAEAFLHLHELVRGDGSSGFEADIVTKASNPVQAIAAAERGLAETRRQRRRGVPRRLKQPAPPAFEEATTRPLSREERLLGLFKLWNCLLLFSPHLEHASVDWAATLPQWIPRIARARTLRAYYEGLLELTSRLKDSHVRIFHPAVAEVLGSHTPPVSLGRVEGRIVVTSTRMGATRNVAKPELPVGAIVTHVDGKPIVQAMKAKARFISASTRQALERDLLQWGRLLAGKPGSTVRVTMAAGKKRRHVTLRRTTPLSEVRVPRPGPPFRRVEGQLGYIDLDALPSAQAFMDALHVLRRTRGLVLDIRGYPQFFVQKEVVSRLLRRPYQSGRMLVPVVTASTALGQDEQWQTIQLRFTPAGRRPYLKPIVVLIDSNAQSAAEDFSIYLRNAGRATFVGTPTAGTDGDVTFVHLPGGARVSFTGMRVLYADGTPFQNVGIVPDVEVAPTLRGMRAGRDEVLEAGIKVLKRMGRSSDSTKI